MSSRHLFRDEHGFTTVSMALSLLISIALVFMSAQVYRVNAASSQVQDVADAAVLAAANQVSDFVLTARLCDAIVLSLSLTSLVSFSLGVVALCAPGAQALGDSLIELGEKLAHARDSFSDQAKESLERYQRALPFLSAARAAVVSSANDSAQSGARYIGVAILVPGEGKEISFASSENHEVGSEIEGQADDLKEETRQAEDAASSANAAKERAYLHDCGNNPSYCLYERASALAGLSASENPLYTASDTWSFSVPLERARAYYKKRLAAEESLDGSVDEQSRSALRRLFYQYACDELARAYVNESNDSFDASFPRFPRNTEEMRSTRLFTDLSYPVTDDGGGPVMHAWSGCPSIFGAYSLGSIEQMEKEGFRECPSCKFSASSMGLVASASTSIENGFEYHYAAIAEAAEEYKKARSELDPLTRKAKESAKGLFDRVAEAMVTAGSARLSVYPPGAIGAISFVVNIGSLPSDFGFESAFVSSSNSLGVRAAVSGATLLEEPSEEGKNAISSLLDGFKENGGFGGVGIILDCWSAVLRAYADGQDALSKSVENGLNSIPLSSSSGLGAWAAGKLKELVEKTGLQPAAVESLKPVLLNSGHIASSSDEAIPQRLLTVKKLVVENPQSSTGVFSSILDGAESCLDDMISSTDSIEIAEIEMFGDGESFTIEVPLPSSVKETASSVIESFFSRLRDVYAEVRGERVWE